MKKAFTEFKKAFTLAEVLITLVIIGVIAALTIPTAVNNTKKNEYVSKLKKTYSTFAQVTNKIIAENGTAENWVTSTENVYNIYKRHLNIIKDCGSNSGCLKQASQITSLHGHGKNAYSHWDNNGMLVILSDGTQVRFEEVFPSCDDTDEGRSDNNCTRIMIDINGEKSPNVLGRDIFWFVIKSNGLYPRGCETGSSSCKKNNPDSWGFDCACKVIRENVMDY